MTAEKSVFSGDYTDIRFVKSRKVAQIVMEIPIEQATAFVAAFGAPDPSTGIPVAIARLQEPSAKAEKPERKWADMPRSQQAGIACNDVQFQDYIIKHFNWPPEIGNETADVVKHICGVGSRKSFDTNPVAAARWDNLYSDYQLHKRGAAA